MPLYEYQCDDCGGRFERIRKFSDPPLDEPCPKCGGTIRKLLSSPAIQFKGSGWYVTDYAKSGSTAESKSDAADPAGKADDKKTGGSDAKGETTAGGSTESKADTSKSAVPASTTSTTKSS